MPRVLERCVSTILCFIHRVLHSQEFLVSCHVCREKVLDFLKIKYPNKTMFDEKQMIDDIASPSLQRDIHYHLGLDVITRVFSTPSTPSNPPTPQPNPLIIRAFTRRKCIVWVIHDIPPLTPYPKPQSTNPKPQTTTTPSHPTPTPLLVPQTTLFKFCDEATTKNISLRLSSGYRMPGMIITKSGISRFTHTIHSLRSRA